MSYVDELAEAIRHTVPGRLIPAGDTDTLFRIYAVLAMAKGEHVVLEDVHDAWSAWMSERNPAHPSLKPLAQLPPDIRQTDEPYLDAIRIVVRERRVGRT